MIRVIFSIVFLYISLFALPKFCFKQTGHFWLQTILSDRTPIPQWETASPSSNELHTINEHLSQRYTFLGGGMQCFAFLSEDKSTVLKFFKHRTSILKKGRFHTHTPFLDPIFESYRIAYEHLQKETGILYVHLNRTQDLHPTVTLIDKIGIAHRVDLDDTEFVLQKRGDLICPTLRNQIERKKIQEAKQSIESLFALFQAHYSKGIKNNDSAFRRNVGFVGTQAIFLDAGSLIYDEKVKSAEGAQRDILQKVANLEKWLMKHYPQLHDHYHELVKSIKGDENES